MATDTDKVRGFIELLNPYFKGRVIDDSMLVKFLTNMQNNVSYNDEGFQSLEYSNMLQHIPDILPTQTASLANNSIAVGASGVVKGCSIAGRCYKIIPIRFIKSKPKDGLFKVFQIIMECFIQYFLSQDATYGNNIPSIYSISKSQIDRSSFSTITIYIEMDLGTSDLSAVLRSREAISFDDFYQLVRIPCTILQYFNTTYGFVHRDFKLNNILLAYDGTGDILHEGTYKIIDFGLSCINIMGPDDKVYSIKSKSFYLPTTPCREQQDMLLFFMFYLDFYVEKSDMSIAPFFDNLILQIHTNNIQPILNLEPVGSNPKSFQASYNIAGKLTNSDKPGAMLTIGEVLRKLEATRAAESGGGGGGAAESGGGGGGGAAAESGGGGGGGAAAPTSEGGNRRRRRHVARSTKLRHKRRKGTRRRK